ncbi:MAG: Fic family protein [Clostridiales bacterium]|nr:Fic family protein [Clostridiales bacterium]MCK9350126.1 Fic family protein [Clostridiales bacterium]MDD3264281.1 Fic family protein [Candidatus Nanoarchaeia archaeon]NLG30892.1 Fic family protein [Clostridiaceae bacterium]
MNNRAGKEVTNFTGDAAYKSFLPAPLPPSPALILDDESVKFLVAAHSQLSALNVRSSSIPNISLFVSAYVRKEALMSSQIEGTQATLEDVFDPKLEENANPDVVDVINYMRATEFAIKKMEELPLCNRLIREIHAVLMDGARGRERSPGEFRHSQNWIGGVGSTLKTAKYIPPNVSDMNLSMSDLEKYMNADDDLDTLIRAGLIHYQFETIHPFLDGNGRVGRMLIILFLIEKGLLSSPVLYISYFLKMNRLEYYDRLSEVRNRGNYEQWVKFFLRAVLESAEDATATIDRLEALRNKNAALIHEKGKATKNTLRLLDYLEANPIIEISKTAKALGLAFNTTSDAIKRLEKTGILVQSAGQQRNRIYSYKAYLELLRDGT